jgi:hypothetical protein
VTRHQRISVRLTVLPGRYLEEYVGKVFAAPFDILLSPVRCRRARSDLPGKGARAQIPLKHLLA